MQQNTDLAFAPVTPPDIEHASMIREEAFDWLNGHFPGTLSFTTGDVLQMAGEKGKRWLIGRLRAQGIGDTEEFSIPATADTLAILYMRSKGVKFREAVDSIIGGKTATTSSDPKYGGVWNRLISIALKRLRRRLAARLLGSAIFSLLRDPKDHPNCLIIVKQVGAVAASKPHDGVTPLSHDYVFQTVLERDAPSCWVLSPFREVLFLDRDQLPTWAEVTSRKFLGLHIETENQTYEILLGTMNQCSVSVDDMTMSFVGRILDIVLLSFDKFLEIQSQQRLETANVPELNASDDLQLWLITQLLNTIYTGSLCEISETSETSQVATVLASSAAKPWEPSPWAAPRSLEMFSGYTSLTGVPLVVEKVEYPWTLVIESIESETRYLNSQTPGNGDHEYSAVALPLIASSGSSMGSLYMLMPYIEPQKLELEVRVLTVFSRIIGEIVERQRAATHTANVSADIATFAVLEQDQFKIALLALLGQRAAELQETQHIQRDVRLPFLMLSAHSPEADEIDPAVSDRLRSWLVETLRHLEWRSFIRSHWSEADDNFGSDSFMGELPGVGVMIALGNLVSKDELDRIRNAFATTIRKITPTNAPVKLLVWVLDVPGERLLDAAGSEDIEKLADDIESWAHDVSGVVDDVDQSYHLAYDEGEWDAALRRVRRALQKEGGQTNSYLRRLAANCCFSLGDWPGALKYAHEATVLSRQELGSGSIRPICQEADAHLCLDNPLRAWDLYTEAVSQTSSHPLPRYYRGQALILLARLLHAYEDERRSSGKLEAAESEHISVVRSTLLNGAMEDLTSAADLLERWGLIPEAYQSRNFHLVPTLLGQGAGYLLAGSPGPAASRLQSARRSFPNDDVFLREFIFAKCWEQGLHREYGTMLLGDGWIPFRDRLHNVFGEPLG